MPDLNQILNRTTSTIRQGLDQATRAGRSTLKSGLGLGKRVMNRPSPKPGMDDVTLARKVESEAFRGQGALKGKIVVNAVDGVVTLRGEAKNPAQIKSIEARVRAVAEVKDVDNLLHPPKTPARRRATAKKKTAEPRRFDRGTTPAESKTTTPKAEPAPTDLAAAREGRKPAPLGSRESDTESSGSLTGGTTPVPPAGAGGPTGPTTGSTGGGGSNDAG